MSKQWQIVIKTEKGSGQKLVNKRSRVIFVFLISNLQAHSKMNLLFYLLPVCLEFLTINTSKRYLLFHTVVFNLLSAKETNMFEQKLNTSLMVFSICDIFCNYYFIYIVGWTEYCCKCIGYKKAVSYSSGQNCCTKGFWWIKSLITELHRTLYHSSIFLPIEQIKYNTRR